MCGDDRYWKRDGDLAAVTPKCSQGAGAEIKSPFANDVTVHVMKLWEI